MSTSNLEQLAPYPARPEAANKVQAPGLVTGQRALPTSTKGYEYEASRLPQEEREEGLAMGLAVYTR